MTQPTGEHASGIKLASAYVDVSGSTAALKADTTKNLDAIAEHGKVVGQQTADNIVTAVGNAGQPAAQGFFNKFHSFATTTGRDMGANAGTAMIAGMKDGMAESDLVQGLDKHFQAINSKMSTAGRDAGMVFHGQWEQLLNEKLDRSKYFGTQHGAAVTEGISEQLAQMDRGGLKDYIDRMQSWKIDAQRAVMDIGNAYAQMSSAGSYSLDQLKQKHIELASAQAKVKEGTLNISEAQQKLRSMGRDVENVATGAAIGESFKRASEGVAGLSSHLGEAGEQAGGLGEKLGGLMGPLAALASPEALGIGAVLGVVGALGEVINKVNDLGEQWEDLGHKIQIQTGATGEQLEQMKADVGDVYKGVTTNMSQTESIFAAVSKGMKDTGQGAKDVTTQLAHLQSMGQGVDATELGTAFKGFNIAGDAAQQTDVINTLLKTAQDTQMPIGEFVSTTQRLAPVMDTLHISFKDTLGMLDEFGQAGIKPEQTFIMLNKAAQDATKHGKDFRTALQDDIDAIKNAPTEEEAQKRAAKIFGASAGRGGAAQATQAIRSNQLNLDPAYLAQLEQADGLVNKTWKDTLTWKDTWTLFKHDASDALRPLSEDLHEKVQAGLENVINWLSAHQGQIVGFATGVTHGFESIVSGIGKVVDYLRPAFAQIKPQLDDFAKAFGPMAVSIGRDVLPVVEALGGALLVTFKDIIENSGPTLEFFAHLFEDVKKVADYIHDHFGPDAKTTLDQFKQDWQGVRDDIGHVVDAVKDVEHWVDEAGRKIGQWKDDLNNIHIPGFGGGHMFGGAIHAQEGIGIPGYGGGDIVPAMLEPGEHVFTKEDVSAMGGQGSMYMLRNMIQAGLLQNILGFDTGGGVPQPGDPGFMGPVTAEQRALAAQRRAMAGLAPMDVGGLPPPMPSAPGILVGEHHKEPKSAAERSQQISEAADKADKGIKYPRQALTGARDLGWFGRAGETAGSWGEALEALEPVSKVAGLVAAPFAFAGAANWGLNLLGKTGALGKDAPTNLSPSERMQQWWFHFNTAPQQYAAHGNKHGPWDQWRPGYKGDTPQNFHIPGTHTNLLDIGKFLWHGFQDWGSGYESGGKVHPAGRDRHESGWVIDRFKQAGIKPAHFQGGGAVGGGGFGGLTDVKALLAAESGRTPYSFGGYSPRGIDCSGLVAEAVEIYLGLPMSGGHPMSTGNEAAWLGAHGFTQGMGPEGTFRVGFYNGGPGGGHTALTLPDGTNAESGGSGGGVRLGGGAAGANSSEFTEHYWLPAREVVSPAGYSGGGGGGSYGGGGTGGSSGATAGFGGGDTGGYGGGGSGGGNYGGAGGGGLWDAVAQAESSGNWSNQDTGGSGHYGGLQFSPSTWAAYGGTDFAANPAEASREQQIEVANRTAFTGWKGTPPQGLQAWETITQGKVPGVTTATSATAFGSGGGNYGGASPADYSPGGAGGGTGGVTPEQLSAQDSKISGKQRSLDVINQRIVEAQQRLTAAQNKEVPDTDKGQATHDKAVAAAQQRVKDLEAERDRAQGDINSLNEERAGMEGGGSKSLVAAKDRVTEANRRLTDAQAKLDEDRANPAKKPSEIIADENAVAAAKEAVAKAQEHQQKVESAPPKKGKKGEPGGGAGWTDEDTGELFGIGYQGIQQQLPEGFSNPLEWGTTKSLSAGLKFFGALLGGDGKEAYNSLVGGGGGGGYGGSGQVSPYVQSLIAQVPGYTGGQQGGGDTVFNHTVNYNGNVTGPTNPDPSAAAVRWLTRSMTNQ